MLGVFLWYNIVMKWKDMKKKKDDEKEPSYTELYDNVISSHINNDQDDYNKYLAERKQMLPETEEKRKEIEEEITLAVLKIWNAAKKDALSDNEDIGFFKYRPFFENELINKYFKIFGAVGDRNIGKTWSSREEIDDVIARQRRFMILRGIDDEVKAQLTSDMGDDGWLNDRGYDYEGELKSPTITKTFKNPKTQKIVSKQTVGYYRPVNTSSKFKSVDFPNVDLMIYEEFPEGNVQNKFYKLVKLMSTVMRFNTNGRLILQSNYTDQYDDILQSLGLGSRKLTEKDFIHFNWEVGALIIFIPSGIYRKPDSKKDIAYRAALGKYSVWKNQYGGGFATEEPVNIINESEIAAVEPEFNIYYVNSTLRTANKAYGAYKMTLYHACDHDGNMHNILTEQQVPNDKPILIYDLLNKVQYPHAILMEIETLDSLLNHWNNGTLKTTSLDVHMKISALFASALKVLLKDEGNIEEIENIVV